MARVIRNWSYSGWGNNHASPLFRCVWWPLVIRSCGDMFAAAEKLFSFPKPFRAKNGALPSKPVLSLDRRPTPSLHPHRTPVSFYRRPEHPPNPQRVSASRPAVFDRSEKEPSLGSRRPPSIRPGQMSSGLDGAAGAGGSVQPRPSGGRRTPALGLEFGGRRQRVPGGSGRRGGIHHLGPPDGLRDGTLCKHPLFCSAVQTILALKCGLFFSVNGGGDRLFQRPELLAGTIRRRFIQTWCSNDSSWMSL